MGFNFKTSAEAGEFLESVYLKVHARNRGVLARSALFIALGRGLPERFNMADSQGVEFQEDTVIGDELGPMVQAAINCRCGESVNEEKYRRMLKRYIDYGCLCLKEIWEDCGSDQTLFISALLKECDFTSERLPIPDRRVLPQKIVSDPVSLSILEGIDPWIINSSGGNGIAVISGQPGTGKTQLALDLLSQVARQGVRFLFFDLKGELEENPANSQQTKNRMRFLQETGDSYVRLIDDRLPINPLYKGDTPAQNAQISTEIAGLVRNFAPQLSASQEREIRNAYDNIDSPDFHSLVEELELQELTGEGFSVIEKIFRFNLFANADDSISIEKWISQSQVIDFKPLGTDNNTKILAVAFILNFIMKQLNQSLPVVNEIQPLQLVLFIDEAHLLLPKEGKSGLLGQLARQGRSWGLPVWLASQDADKFDTTGAQGTNFADLSSCGIHFSPQLLNEREQKNILGKAITKQLEKGEAVLRLKGETIVGQARQYWRDRGQP